MIISSGRILTARWLWWLIGAVAAALLSTGCAYNLVSGGRVNQEKSDKIEAGIQDLRQLHFKKPVPLVVKSQDEAAAMMEADLMRDYTDQHLKVQAIPAPLTGLYPTATHLTPPSLTSTNNH